MAESQTFYTSYAPAMDVLKHKGKSLNFECMVFLYSLFSCDVIIFPNNKLAILLKF